MTATQIAPSQLARVPAAQAAAAGVPRLHRSCCPNCGDTVRFLTCHGSPADIARFEDEAPWVCDGCGCHGVDDELEAA